MRTFFHRSVLTTLVALGAGLPVVGTAADKATPPAMGGTVKLEFKEPEKFRDVRLSSMTDEASRDVIFEQFQKHLATLARRFLPADQTLSITITDIDLAGEFEPQRGPRFNDVRIVKDIYPPRIDLVYQLRGADGTVLAEGVVHLTDLTFQFNADLLDRDSTHYEKVLLTDWFRKTFPVKH